MFGTDDYVLGGGKLASETSVNLKVTFTPKYTHQGSDIFPMHRCRTARMRITYLPALCQNCLVVDYHKA